MVETRDAVQFPLTTAEMPLFILIDGHALVHRSYHAISVQRRLSIKATGEETSGVYGFLNVFLRSLQDWKATYCAVAFDTPAPTFRHQQYVQYKAQRPAMPSDLRQQIERVKQLMRTFGVPIFELDGYEADDIIGTLCRQAEELGLDTIILTGDRDTFQLISPRVRVDMFHSIQERKVYGETELMARYSGLTPAQQPDFKALVGDPSDNIAGVPRIGDKRAADLLTKYGNLEGIYSHLEEIKPQSVQQSLAENRELAFANRPLTTIVRDVPVKIDLEACRCGQFDRQAAVAFLTKLEFFSVIPRVPKPTPDHRPQTADRVDESPQPAVSGQPSEGYQIVDTAEKLEEMLSALQEAGGFTFDTQTTDTDPMRAELVGMSFAAAPERAWYVPVGHQQGPQLPVELVLARLKPLLESPHLSKCGHKANYHLTLMANHGIHVRSVDFDTTIAGHLLGKGAGPLSNLSLELLGREMAPIGKLLGAGRKQITLDRVPVLDAAAYAAAAADVTLQLRPILEAHLASQGLTPLMADMEMPLLPVLVAMQRHGIKVDASVLHEMARSLNEQMQQVETSTYSNIGHTVNINSPQQLSDLLFKELGLARTKRTKTGSYSTDASSLEALKGSHPVVDQILEYRQLSKLKSTYVDALPEMINPSTGRIHTSYSQTGAATGRVSSSDPNLQNIPIRTELGRQVRKAFVAEDAPKWTLLSADYSQIELRVLAHLSQDPALLEAFRRGEDIHSATGALMFDVPLEKVTSAMRRIAKILNFGVIYGLSPYGISQQTEFSTEEGTRFIQAYFSKYPGIRDYIESVKAKTRQTLYVETLAGRCRYVPEITSPNFNVRSAAERITINMPIQGTAADIMKLAMIKVYRRLLSEKLRTRLLLQVHDELVFEVPQEEIDRIKEVVDQEMPGAMSMAVPLKVDVKIGYTWGDME